MQSHLIERSWLTERSGLFERDWVRQLAAFLGYAIGYTLFKSVSLPNLLLPAGFRLLCLMFIPRKYWVALAFGEIAALGEVSYKCWTAFGPAFALARLFPPSVLAMAAVYLCQTRLSLIKPNKDVRMDVFLLCAMMVSTLTVLLSAATVCLTPAPPGETDVIEFWTLFRLYFLGSYLGILTVAPLALVASEGIRKGVDIKAVWQRLSSSRLLFDTVCLVAPALLVLAWLAHGVDHSFSLQVRAAMLLPPAWLAVRHGWRGAAVGGTSASLILTAIMPSRLDEPTMQAQTILAVALTMLFTLGNRISSLDQRDEKDRMDGRLALQLAQQGLNLGELRMRQAAYSLEQIGVTIRDSHERLLDRLRNLLPAAEEHVYRRRGLVATHQVFRLADSLYPRACDHLGLVETLREGPIARALDESQVRYHFAAKGVELDRLAPGTQIAIYRLACDAVISLLVRQPAPALLRLCLRGGFTHGQRWAVMRVQVLSERRVIRLKGLEDYMDTHTINLQNRLGGSGPGLRAFEDRLKIYGGMFHSREEPSHRQLTLLIHDAQTPAILN